ncbi:hypothetical protein ACIA6C_17650 [Streptomyces sp. NPDC051578]|uniref:hypothetical protein n=1 Tax=unclassified Streptomyces TaxID=2593676 RepID=UPI0037BD7039
MAKNRKSGHPSHGEGPSRHEGTEQHGWSPDVDATRQQDNPSAERSFHPDEYAGEGPDRRSGTKASPTKADEGTPVKTGGRRGEHKSKGSGSGDKGHHDMGEKGASRRPSGTKDASAYTGVDPQDPPGGRRGG